jgi:hypothetical protein
MYRSTLDMPLFSRRTTEAESSALSLRTENSNSAALEGLSKDFLARGADPRFRV